MQYKVYKGYKIYDDGTVIGQKGWKLKPETTKNGYNRIQIYFNGVKERPLLHRLIMSLFIGDSDLDVNHKNGIKTDNRLENLEYVTRRINIQHAWDNNLSKKRFGDKMHTSKISDKDVDFIRQNKGIISGQGLSDMFGITRTSIYRIQNNRSRYVTA